MTREDPILVADDSASLRCAYAAALAEVHPGDAETVAVLRKAFRTRRWELGVASGEESDVGPDGSAVPEVIAAEDELAPSRWWWVVLVGALYVLGRFLLRMARDS